VFDKTNNALAPAVALEVFNRLQVDSSAWPLGLAREFQVVIARDKQSGGELGIATSAAPLHALAACDMRASTVLTWYSCTQAQLDALLERAAQALPALSNEVLGSVESSISLQTLDVNTEVLSLIGHPVVRFVSAFLNEALRAGASDIHLETAESGLGVKFRLDGVLVRGTAVPQGMAANNVISRIKVLSDLDIAERRRPQDGRFKVKYRGREIDLRISVIPGAWGEDAVIRILDKEGMLTQGGDLTLSALGFDELTIQATRRLARLPYGLLLVTGPTGSGKTTTMYAMLSETASADQKTITIEDPIEYRLRDTLQIPVNEKTGFSFAVGLRSVLRHDPDRIMIGEIRDRETADIAVQSALTGHPVFSSVHANNAFDVVGRFLHMGLDVYNLTTALNGVVAQRLLRKVCVTCADEDSLAAHHLQSLLSTRERKALDGFWRRGSGCVACRNTGRGRMAIMEVVSMDETLRNMIVAREPGNQLKAYAREHGMVSLREQALSLARQGITTLEEVGRVTLAE
jgi:general secretion pathway protein E